MHWFHRADECAQELAVHLRRERIHIEALTGEEFTCIFHAINAGRLDFYVRKSGGRQFGPVLRFFQCARDAPDPKQNALADFRPSRPTVREVTPKKLSIRLLFVNLSARGFL